MEHLSVRKVRNFLQSILLKINKNIVNYSEFVTCCSSCKKEKWGFYFVILTTIFKIKLIIKIFSDCKEITKPVMSKPLIVKILKNIYYDRC